MNINIKHYKWIVLSIVTIVAFVTNVDATIVIIALPAMMKSLNLSVIGGNWIITSYLITSTIFLLPAGKWADTIGKKKIFCIGVSIFTFATFLCGLSSSGAILLIFRFVQGIGAAMALSATMPILIESFPQNQLGVAIALNSTAWITGSIAGPIIGGFLLANYSWPSIYWVTVPFGLIAIFGAGVILPKTDNIKRINFMKNDWSGMLTLTIGLSLLFIVISEGQSWGWISIRTIGLAIIFLLSIWLFVKIEKRENNDPILDLRLLKDRTNVINLLLVFSYCTAFFSLPYLLSFYLQGLCGFSPSLAAIYMVPLSLPQLIMGPAGGALADRLGAKRILLTGNIILIISILLLTIQLHYFKTQYFIIILVIISIGNALAWPALSKMVFTSITKEQSGAFSGLFYTLYNIGRALTQPLSIFAMQFVLPAIVLSRFMTNNQFYKLSGLRSSAILSLQMAFIVVFILFAISLCLSTIRRGKKSNCKDI